MKRFWIGMLVCGAGTAGAQVFQPVTSGRMADVNSRIIQSGDLQLRTIPREIYRTGPAAVAGRRVSPRAANTWQLDQTLRRTSLLPVRTVPQTNFTAKRAESVHRTAALADGQPATERTATGPAPIRRRRIDAGTADGQRELRDQLRKIQVQPDE